MKTFTDPPTPKFCIDRNAPNTFQNKSEWFIGAMLTTKPTKHPSRSRLSNDHQTTSTQFFHDICGILMVPKLRNKQGWREEWARRSMFWSICFGRRQKSEFIFCHVATQRVLSQWLEFLCLENPIPKQTHCRQFWKSLVWKTTGRWLLYDILWPTHFGVMAFLNWKPRKYAMEISPRWVWWKMHVQYCENR